MRLPFLSWVAALACVAALLPGDARAANEAVFYVATNGNDAWSGRLPAPKGADGPFATLERARDEIRALKAKLGLLPGSITVLVRGGTYYLRRPLAFTAEDSGTSACPIVFRAYPGEKPVLSGGVPVTGWRKASGSLRSATVPNAAQIGGKQLFVGGERQVRARHPNFDPAKPTTGGFLFARTPKGWTGSFGACVGSIHNPGDFLEYDLTIPAAGEYTFWMYYGAANKPFGNDRMDGRTQATVDGGPPVPLTNLPDTGDWGRFAWSACAKLTLSAGQHALRWTNSKGGGLNLDAFALCDDPAWQPQGTDPKPPAGKQLLVLQCESFARAQGSQMTVDGFVDSTGKQLYFDPGALRRWPDSPDKVLNVFVYEGGLCSNTMAPVAGIDEEQSLVTTTRQVAGYRVDVGARFFVDNVREELDSPGEWYLDRATGQLTYWPRSADFARQPAGFAAGTVLSNLDRLIEVKGEAKEGREVGYLSFEGFAFEATDYALPTQDWYHSDSAALWLGEANHIRVADSRFTNLGGTAVVLVGGCHDNELVHNEITFCGAGAYTINGNPQNQHLGAAAPDRPAQKNTIAGNTIHHTGLLFKHGNPICANSGVGNLISHNTIHDAPRMGILLTADCAGNRIEYNEVRRTSLETGDTGAIYAYAVSKLTDPNVIEGNLVVDSVGMGTTKEGAIVSPHYSWGIYIDGESSNFQVRHNIVVRNVLGGVFINGGHHNTVEHNILVDGSDTEFWYSDYAQRGTGNVFRHNIIAWSHPKAKLGLGGQNDAAHLDSDYNVFWHAGLPVPELEPMQKRGLDVHSVVADPLFTDPAKEDFRLRADSPALKLGFQQMDASRIGAKGYRAR